MYILLIMATTVMKSWTTQVHGTSIDQKIIAGEDLKRDTPVSIGADGKAYTYLPTATGTWSADFLPSALDIDYATVSHNGDAFAYTYTSAGTVFISTATQTPTGTLSPPIQTATMYHPPATPAFGTSASAAYTGSNVFTVALAVPGAGPDGAGGAIWVFSTLTNGAGSIITTASEPVISAAAGVIVFNPNIVWDSAASTLVLAYTETTGAYIGGSSILRVTTLYCPGGIPSVPASAPVSVPDVPSTAYNTAFSCPPMALLGQSGGSFRCAVAWLSGAIVASYAASSPGTPAPISFAGANLATNDGAGAPGDLSKITASILTTPSGKIYTAWGNKTVASAPISISVFTIAANVLTFVSQSASPMSVAIVQAALVYDTTISAIYCVALTDATIGGPGSSVIVPITASGSFGAPVSESGTKLTPFVNPSVVYTPTRGAIIAFGIKGGATPSPYMAGLYFDVKLVVDASAFAGLVYNSTAAGDLVPIDQPGTIHTTTTATLTPGSLVYADGGVITQTATLTAVRIGIATTASQLLLSPQLVGGYVRPYSASALPTLAPGAMIYVYDYAGGPVIAFADGFGVWQKLLYTAL